jgi:hypothetical protein
MLESMHATRKASQRTATDQPEGFEFRNASIAAQVLAGTLEARQPWRCIIRKTRILTSSVDSCLVLPWILLQPYISFTPVHPWAGGWVGGCGHTVTRCMGEAEHITVGFRGFGWRVSTIDPS